jgi:flagellar motor protein MotB
MFRRKTEQSPKNGEEENPFLLSFSDLMASLLAIFILALVVMMIQLHLQKRKLEEDRKNIVVIWEQYEKMLKEKEALENERNRIRVVLEELRKSLNEIETTQSEVAAALEGVGLREKSLAGMLEGIQKDLKQQGIEVLVAENGTVLRIPENALSFKLSEFSIQDLYKNSADVIGATLLKALENDENRKLLDTVFIEGHTDSVPNRKEMGNWGLSTYRAISLWLHWTENPGRFTQLKNLKTAVREEGAIERPLISTSGYADTRPADLAKVGMAHPIGVGNPADRRIDIRFTLASSEKKDLGELKGQLDSMRAKTSDLIKKLKEAE